MHTCGGILELVAGLHGLGLISERGTERERERERDEERRLAWTQIKTRQCQEGVIIIKISIIF